MSDATDVLYAIDQLRRDLSGYHGQLKAHNDLQRHCDHQRERIVELEAIHARDKAENAKLRELVRHMHTCMEHYEPDGSVSCDRCPLDNDTGDCDYEQRMSELGIEVDG
jgi:hypothetical protein